MTSTLLPSPHSAHRVSRAPNRAVGPSGGFMRGARSDPHFVQTRVRASSEQWKRRSCTRYATPCASKASRSISPGWCSDRKEANERGRDGCSPSEGEQECVAEQDSTLLQASAVVTTHLGECRREFSARGRAGA
eukprot:scaffold86717_cov28-Tisochrysis_lutea.AAC.2